MACTNTIAWALRVAFFAAVASAHAAGTATLSIGATILSAGNCRFNTAGPTALAFGGIDPSAPTDVTGNAQILFRCNGSVGTAVYSVTSDDGLYETGPGASRMRHVTDTSSYLPYTLNTPIAGSVPRNTDTMLTVTGTIRVADFQNARAGNYTDTVVLSIAP